MISEDVRRGLVFPTSQSKGRTLSLVCPINLKRAFHQTGTNEIEFLAALGPFAQLLEL